MKADAALALPVEIAILVIAAVFAAGAALGFAIYAGGPLLLRPSRRPVRELCVCPLEWADPAQYMFQCPWCGDEWAREAGRWRVLV